MVTQLGARRSTNFIASDVNVVRKKRSSGKLVSATAE
jgi:hypothetical protein